MERFKRFAFTLSAAAMLAGAALGPTFAHAATVSGRVGSLAVDPGQPTAPKTLTGRTPSGGTVELHLSCGPESSHPFVPCDEEFIRFCTVLGGNSEIEEPQPGIGIDEPSGTCDVPGPELPEPHD